MIFQALDDKKECIGIYTNGKMNFNEIPEGLTQTWSYSPYLAGIPVEYASIYAEGKSLTDLCPEELKAEWALRKKKLKAFQTSFIEAKVSLKDNCYFDLMPVKFLEEYCETKNKITEHVLKTHKRPEEYDFFRRFQELLTDIKFRKLNIDYTPIKTKLVTDAGVTQFKKISDKEHIIFDMFGSVTGRLTTADGSFPIHNFQKSYREILKPQNDWFVVFDVNAAELRTSLALIGDKQPEGDLYEWIAKEIFEGTLTRAQTKDVAISWLYNSSNPSGKQHAEQLNSLFKKEELRKKYWDGKIVSTPFKRQIEADEHHSISYLNQSTFIDLFHRQILKADDYLKGKDSFISFMLHDELVLDMTDDEKNEILKIVEILEDTPYGKFLVNVKVGKNYGDLKKLNLKREKCTQ